MHATQVTIMNGTVTQSVSLILHSTGNVLCNPDNPIRVSTTLEARVIVFDIEIPITMGLPVRNLTV